MVTYIHKVMQFKPKQVFKHLADEVSEHRAQADRNPDQKVLAELYKLLGNSYYGKCLTDKEKHLDVKYIHEERATRAVNDPMFRKMEQVSESKQTDSIKSILRFNQRAIQTEIKSTYISEFYEVSMAKNKVKHDLPVLIAFFVYSYAKLRMLSFYYDFLTRILHRDDFELMEMDTGKKYYIR